MWTREKLIPRPVRSLKLRIFICLLSFRQIGV